MKLFSGPVELLDAVGESLGSSQWHLLTQDLVDRFAANTGDRQWIHIDPVRAAAGPFRGTIAHGYLVLAMIPALMNEAFQVSGVSIVLNKELRKLRFLAPVPVGARVRAAVRLVAVRRRPRGYWEADLSAIVQIEGLGTPAVTAEFVFLYQQS